MSKQRDQLLQDVEDAFSDMKRALHSFGPDGFSALGLSMSQLGMLRKISLCQPITQAALAKKLQLTPGAINQVIDTLEQADCIMRTPDELDRRATYLSVSRRGGKILKEFAKMQHQIITKILKGVSNEDIAAFIRVQKSITTWLETEHTRKEK